MSLTRNSIRKFVYASLLALTTLSFVPSMASAQEAEGKFTLAHDVHWENAVVPAGEYRFSFGSDGVTGVLMLSKLDGARTGFMLMVHDTDEISNTGPAQLLLKTASEGSYVSEMRLPEFGLAMHFRANSAVAEKQIARAVTAASAAAQ